MRFGVLGLTLTLIFLNLVAQGASPEEEKCHRFVVKFSIGVPSPQIPAQEDWKLFDRSEENITKISQAVFISLEKFLFEFRRQELTYNRPDGHTIRFFSRDLESSGDLKTIYTLSLLDIAGDKLKHPDQMVQEVFAAIIDDYIKTIIEHAKLAPAKGQVAQPFLLADMASPSQMKKILGEGLLFAREVAELNNLELSFAYGGRKLNADTPVFIFASEKSSNSQKVKIGMLKLRDSQNPDRLLDEGGVMNRVRIMIDQYLDRPSGI